VRRFRFRGASLLDKTQVELPACWISGYYGSGKSSFAKLLGLALDGLELEKGKPLSAALLAQDRSPNAQELRDAWARVLEKVKPMAVVFDVGSKARDEEQVHAVIVRQVQQRLGYSKTSNLVAEYELKLELEGLDSAFLDKVKEVHSKPWSALKDSQLVEDEFSRVMHALRPDLFPDPMSWVDSRAGSAYGSKRSADEAVEAVHNMLEKRYPGRTLFVVVDEVSQYVHENTERMLALQSFVSALGQRMKGKAWLLATGQQKLEEGTGAGASIAKLKDRFPPALRVHLGVANMRDVVHKRLLRKKPIVEGDLRALFQQHRADLSLYAYRGGSPRPRSSRSTRCCRSTSISCSTSRRGCAAARPARKVMRMPFAASCSCSATCFAKRASPVARSVGSSRWTSCTTCCAARSAPTCS